MSPNDIGFGGNLNFFELPQGLAIRLAQSPAALNLYGNLTDNEKQRLIGHVQGAETGEEAHRRVVEAVSKLSQGNRDFFA